MLFDLLDLGRKIINSSYVFGLQRFINVWEEADLQAVLSNVETRVYGKKGLECFENELPLEADRLLKRSFAQYLATQAMYKSAWIRSLQETLFFFFLIGYITILPLLSLCSKSRPSENTKPIVIFHHYPYLYNIIKDIYREDNRIFITKAPTYFSLKDLSFLVFLLRQDPRSLLYPHFIFSIVKWIGIYSGIIHVYQPKAILNFTEGSFVASSLTYYLREKGIKHINHMHGEIFSSPRFAFSEFDLFIVYGAFWKNLYRSLKCKAEFIILENSNYKYLYQININRSQCNNDNSLLILHNQLLNVQSAEYDKLCQVLVLVPANWTIRFRYHPNEKENGLKFLKALREKFQSSTIHISIDEYQTDSLDKSLAVTKIALGRISAALFQAWIAGCKVIYLEETTDLKKRYNGSENVLFLKTGISGQDIEEFLYTPLSQNTYETILIDYVAKVV